jgi:hypothetical protein
MSHSTAVPEHGLMNAIAQKRARALQVAADDWF